MTDDEIERLALAAGCFTPGALRNYWAITDQMLRRFAELSQEVERNNADNLRQQVEDQAAEIEWLRDELQICCELKRTYQEQAAAEVCGAPEKQTHEVRVTAQPIDSAPCAQVPVHPRLGRLWANVRPAGAETPVPSYKLDDLYDKAALDAAVAAERERWERIRVLADQCAEWHIGDGDECGTIARELLAILRA